MGWYDAFKGHTERIDMSRATDSGGSAAKGFGDAFKDISKSMLEVEDAKERSALRDLQTQESKNKLEEYETTKNQKMIDNSLKDAFQRYNTKDEYEKTVGGLEYASPEVKATSDAYFQKKTDDAFKTDVNSLNGSNNLKLFKNNYQTGNGYGSVSPEAQDSLNKAINTAETSEAAKDTSLSKLASKERDIKHATEVQKLNAKVVEEKLKRQESSKEESATKITPSTVNTVRNYMSADMEKQIDPKTGMVTMSKENNKEADFLTQQAVALMEQNPKLTVDKAKVIGKEMWNENLKRQEEVRKAKEQEEKAKVYDSRLEKAAKGLGLK